MIAYLVYLADANGVTRYYTGRAGRHFLSAHKGDAFTYSTMRGAINKAYTLSKMLGMNVTATAVS